MRFVLMVFRFQRDRRRALWRMHVRFPPKAVQVVAGLVYLSQRLGCLPLCNRLESARVSCFAFAKFLLLVLLSSIKCERAVKCSQPTSRRTHQVSCRCYKVPGTLLLIISVIFALRQCSVNAVHTEVECTSTKHYQ